jgi:hypothetical protein
VTSVVEGKSGPDITMLVREATRKANQATNIGIAACGLDSMMRNIRNRCAEIQGRYYLGREVPGKCGYLLRLSLGNISTTRDFRGT